MASQIKRFTFFLEYAGGTYLRQIVADNLSDAFKRWHKLLRQEDIPENGVEIANGFVQSAIDEGGPVAVIGLEGVWCATALVGDGSAMVHVVCSLIEGSCQ